MWALAAIVTMLCFGINNFIFKMTAGRQLSKVHMQFYFYTVAFCLMTMYAVFNGIGAVHIIPVILGAMIGILNANGNIQMAKAFEKGPASLTSPLISTNAIVPILSAALIFHEHITLLQWGGILLMMFSAVVIQYTPSSSKGNAVHYKSWLFHVALSFSSFGVLGILMKTSTHFHYDAIVVLMSMYAGGAIYLLCMSMLQNEAWYRAEAKWGAMIGSISVVGYSCYFFALNTGVASIVFPIVSLSCLVVVLASCWVYKERLKLYQLAGIGSAVIGIILTKI